MKAITIHGIDPVMEKLILQKAHESGVSLNKTLKKLLEHALGIRPAETQKHRNDFAEFAGKWTEKEFKTFEESVAPFRQIDKDDWQ
ncbi:MAG: hypothetical protein A2293_06130 [Elusimicrobia bacterium RIFOXYB2_FULL_49_7]|nr:MAG: hypothetical protein A2293_06130 [Elusimicrobia bacterium RIFOXYB2_FULL_49_7]